MIEVLNIKTVPAELNTGDLLVHDGRLWLVDDVVRRQGAGYWLVELSSATEKHSVRYSDWADARIMRVRVFQRPD